MIRTAVSDDQAAVVTLLRNSHEGAGFDRPDGPTGFCFPFDPAYAQRMFSAHLLSPNALCIVHVADGKPRGVLMAVAAEHMFGPVWLANESVWWIDPDARGSAAVRMLDYYEAWARARGCRFTGMAGMGNDPLVGKLYQRRGYHKAELHFLKSLAE